MMSETTWRMNIPIGAKTADSGFRQIIKGAKSRKRISWPVTHLARCLAFASVLMLTGAPSRAQEPSKNSFEPVGPLATNRIVVPVNQVLSPAGLQVELPGLRPQVISLSPDGKILATSGKTSELIIIHPVTGSILQRVQLPSEKATDANPGAVSTHILEPDTEGQVSFTGLCFSPDGTRIFLSNVNGSIKVFNVAKDRRVAPVYSIPLPPSGVAGRPAEIPAGLAISKDGNRLYVALNLSNRLLELDATSGKQLRMFEVGTAPYGVIRAGQKVYVSNWGGRRPDAQAATGPAGHGNAGASGSRAIHRQ